MEVERLAAGAVRRHARPAFAGGWTAVRAVASPSPLAGWDQAFQSNAGLARRHNTRAFLLVLASEVRDSRNEQLSKLAPIVTAALAKVP
jgi:hypothetical protein